MRGLNIIMMNQEKREKINPSLEKSMNNAIEFLAVALNLTGHNIP